MSRIREESESGGGRDKEEGLSGVAVLLTVPQNVTWYRSVNRCSNIKLLESTDRDYMQEI